MKSVTSRAAMLAALAATLPLPVCAHAARPAAPAAPSYGPEADYPVTIGDPYVIGGVTYTPADTLNYDAVGYAHAGTEGSGISGAHHVLPLPCYVEVTSLDSGHTILVRLNRRGPMHGKQLIELSPAAWAQLGLPPGVDAPVRVRRVNPPEPERAALREGNRVPERMETPPGLRAALRRRLVAATTHTADEPPSATLSGSVPQAPHLPLPPQRLATQKAVAARPIVPPRAPVPAAPKPLAPRATAPEPEQTRRTETRHMVVQVAAFSTRAHAEKAAQQVGGKVEAAGKLWRVRIAVTSEEAAQAALAKTKHSGYAGAIILHHD